MKTTENIELITVGALVKELKKYVKRRAEYDVLCWTPDDSTLCVVGTGLDEDGDVCIWLEDIEWSECYYDVQQLYDELDEYDKGLKVYLAGCGLYLNCDRNGDGSVFCDPDDEEETLGCYASVFGEYEEEYDDPQTEEELSEEEKRAIKKARREKIEGIVVGVLFLLMIPLMAYGLYYDIAALVKHTMPIGQCIIGIIVLAVLLFIFVGTLLSLRNKK